MNSTNVRFGHLTLILGPMWSGKSTSLIARLSTYADLKFSTLYINHSDDTRGTVQSGYDAVTCEALRPNSSSSKATFGDNIVSTHSSQYKGLSSRLSALKVKSLKDINVSPFSVIGVDECQFFEDLVPSVHSWVSQNKIVLCAGLDGDSFMKPFGHTLELIPFCDEVTKLRAKCQKCLDSGHLIDAPFTARLCLDKSTKLIGGEDKYTAMCRYHYKEHDDKK